VHGPTWPCRPRAHAREDVVLVCFCPGTRGGRDRREGRAARRSPARRRRSTARWRRRGGGSTRPSSASSSSSLSAAIPLGGLLLAAAHGRGRRRRAPAVLVGNGGAGQVEEGMANMVKKRTGGQRASALGAIIHATRRWPRTVVTLPACSSEKGALRRLWWPGGGSVDGVRRNGGR
jgi:hypothetical protein